MIEYLLIAILVLSVIHCVYESCILPELRLQFVYRLFKLRDDLRRAQVNNEITDKSAYQVLQESLNNGINSVFVADYLLVSEIRHTIKTNKQLAKQIEKRVRTLDSTQDPFIRDIRRKSRKIFSYALMAGMGTWFLYLIPIALVVTFYETLKDVVKDTLAMPSRQLNSATSERDGCGQALAFA